ncbi:MAG: DUF86 domain-containing protein [Bacteroidia bacterium]|nr:MAG: DUF86 domain-containing protein [Bacteroidia bacterium]
MPRDDRVYLEHIRDAITRIEQYTKGIDESEFKREALIQDGVIRQLEIIGEAVKRLSPSFCSSHAHIPWQDIARMRDKLIHDYFGVDIEKVWLTVKEDLPPLKAEISASLGKK